MVAQSLSGRDLLRIVGASVAAFSLIMGLLVLFVLPASCSFLAGLQLLILSLLLILGVTTFLLMEIWRQKQRRQNKLRITR